MPQDHNSATLLRVADLRQNRPTRFDIRPDEAAMQEIATSAGILGLRKLRFAGELRAHGARDWQLKAEIGATVVQACVTTLEPVTTRIEEAVLRLFVAEMPDYGEEEEIEMSEDENTDPLGSEIDLLAVMRESLMLNLPLYPRKSDAHMGEAVFTEPGKVAMRDEDTRPFAGLAGLREKLANKGETDQ